MRLVFITVGKPEGTIFEGAPFCDLSVQHLFQEKLSSAFVVERTGVRDFGMIDIRDLKKPSAVIVVAKSIYIPLAFFSGNKNGHYGIDPE